MKKLIFSDNTDSPIRLYQTGFDRFRIEYGKYVKKQLDYAVAAKTLGECIMHALACKGLIKEKERFACRGIR